MSIKPQPPLALLPLQLSVASYETPPLGCWRWASRSGDDWQVGGLPGGGTGRSQSELSSVLPEKKWWSTQRGREENNQNLSIRTTIHSFRPEWWNNKDPNIISLSRNVTTGWHWYNYFPCLYSRHRNGSWAAHHIAGIKGLHCGS